jgi:hypothetical protein
MADDKRCEAGRRTAREAQDVVGDRQLRGITERYCLRH